MGTDQKTAEEKVQKAKVAEKAAKEKEKQKEAAEKKAAEQLKQRKEKEEKAATKKQEAEAAIAKKRKQTLFNLVSWGRDIHAQDKSKSSDDKSSSSLRSFLSNLWWLR